MASTPDRLLREIGAARQPWSQLRACDAIPSMPGGSCLPLPLADWVPLGLGGCTPTSGCSPCASGCGTADERSCACCAFDNWVSAKPEWVVRTSPLCSRLVAVCLAHLRCASGLLLLCRRTGCCLEANGLAGFRVSPVPPRPAGGLSSSAMCPGCVYTIIVAVASAMLVHEPAGRQCQSDNGRQSME